MKKLKLLPTILMLVLCVGVLAIGIYAVTPTKNTISGSITINASNPSVSISAYHGTDTNNTTNRFFYQESVRSGYTIDFDSYTFNADTKNTQSELDSLDKVITFVIGNPSTTTPLGVFFSTSAVGETPTSSDVASSLSLFTSGETEILNAEFSGYTQVPANNGTANVTITFNMLNFYTGEESETIDIGETFAKKIYLNIHEYNGDMLPAVTLGIAGQPLTNAMYTSAGSPSKVRIAENVTEISASAFQGATNLTSIELPSSLVTIGRYPFRGCTALKTVYYNAINANDADWSDRIWDSLGNGPDITVYIGKDVTRIPSYMFSAGDTDHHEFTRLTTVIFEDGSICKTIGDYAFADTPRLQSIELPNSIENIGASAFLNMYRDGGLKNISIPSSVKSIGSSSLCSLLETVTLNGCTNLSIDKDAFGDGTVSTIYVKQGTTLSEEFTLPTKSSITYGYTATDWNTDKIATSHTLDTVYSRTVTKN